MLVFQGPRGGKLAPDRLEAALFPGAAGYPPLETALVQSGAPRKEQGAYRAYLDVLEATGIEQGRRAFGDAVRKDGYFVNRVRLPGGALAFVLGAIGNESSVLPRYAALLRAAGLAVWPCRTRGANKGLLLYVC